VYELILGAVHSSIGDQAQDIVRSTADTVFEVLKTDSLKDLDKKKEIETVLGIIPNEQFSQLVSLSKRNY
jgi:pre-mRNA-splicing helicase BRR2